MHDLEFKPAENNIDEFSIWCKSLLDLYNTRKFIARYESVHSISHLRMIKWVLSHTFKRQDQILKTMLLDSIMSANAIAPGAGVYVPWFLYNKSPNETQRHSSNAYLEMTLDKTNNSHVKDLFRSIFTHAGPTTKLVVKKSNELEPVIKYRNAFQFPLKLDTQFRKMVGGTNSIEYYNPIIIMIEGAPETVGEINSLLEWNNKSDRPVLLIARSFTEEISATLATNWLKGTLSILPLRYGDTLETINLAADMCAVTRGQLISLHFGDVISSAVLNRDKWGEVESALWNDKGLFLTKDINVQGHVNTLLQKINSTDNEDMYTLYQDRILSLSNNALEIWIPKEDEELIEELDSLICHYNAFVATGATKTDIGYLPKCFVDAAATRAQSLKESILNIGGFLLRVDNEVVA